MIFIFLFACNQQSFERTQIATRVSLDVRGKRPSIGELQRAEKSAEELEILLEEFMNAPEFGWNYANLMSGFWKTEVIELDHEDHEYSMSNFLPLITAMGQEPLRMLAEIANEDIPYQNFVTADWTVNNEIMAQWSPTNYPEGETGWKKVDYTDGRPAAGILVSNGLWWRYNSTQNNANRGRANIISKNILCNDYLDRNIQVNRNLNLLDQNAIDDALRSSPTCYTCHSSLDQFAANFWGFYRHFRFSPDEQFSYHPERERDWETFTGIAPGYFGQATHSLEHLGQLIANDPQYYDCIVERSMEQLYHRPLTVEDISQKWKHKNHFLANQANLRDLVSSIIQDPNYRNMEESSRRMVSPHQYTSQLEALTLFQFTVDELDVFETDIYGIRSISGGSGADHSQPHFLSTSPTLTLVVERMAQAAAHYVTHNTKAANHFFNFDFQKENSDTEENFAFLFHKTLSRELETEELDTIHSLWLDVYQLENDPIVAWQAVLSFLFRHPDFLRY